MSRGARTAVVGLVVLVGRAAAHDPPDSRIRPPLPLELLLLGAAATVGATALLLAFGGNGEPDRERVVTRLGDTRARTIAAGLRFTFLATVGWAVVVGLTGEGSTVTTAFVWGVWLKGIGLLSAVVGSPWRTISPWRTVYDTVGSSPRYAYPERLGRWPAVVGFLLVGGVVENLTTIPSDQEQTAVLVVGYAAVMLAGAAVFGSAWFRNADTFEVLYGLFGRVAPVTVAREADGVRILLRAPWAGCARPVADAATVVFVVATVYTVSFDGFTNTLRYEYLLGDLYALVNSGAATELVAYMAGLLLFLGGFVAVIGVGEALGFGGPLEDGLLTLAPTVLPIAVAYEMAHSYVLVGRETTTVVATVTGGHVVDPLSSLSIQAFWASQMLLVTGGHVAAVVVAHHVTAERYRFPGRGHLPLTGLMIGYTVLSLWIVSIPMVR